eukprot:gnl/MRDRNA2_/MRDRNA2_30014_c0_seq1.p1 gnl/MRDRNA2_/MRDRNA2_30014_c0~~gnl/MRDRNA2_/MRDRNA2_30014_c0_seq1.p1  ORF type:complete len:831 (-),score=147.70 gnl/MRDRNA2_/MRDRNA2_30014_c0_seq1:33-2525(-)
MSMDSTATTTAKVADPAICEVGGGGLFLPLFSGEQEWDNSLRIVLYLFGLLWCFMGVGIIADVFMGAIEAITSKKKRVKVKGTTNRYVTVKVWNDTVANLTLMALGSSAPEILLSIIELLGNDFFSGALGPSTIVGSAAFNLFCISAVCIAAIPEGETRIIKDTHVFSVTASFSVFAYLWLVVILMLCTPDVVDIWEGLLSFLFFPILVVLAYMADIGMFSSKRDEVVTKRVVAAEMSKEELAETILRIKQRHGADITDQQALTLIEKETAQPKTRAEYRVAAVRSMTGGRKIGADYLDDSSYAVKKIDNGYADEAESAKPNKAIFEFGCEKLAVLESGQSIMVSVTRKGNVGVAAKVDYNTKDGDANAGTDYVATSGTLEFNPGETSKEFKVVIIDDTAYELDEHFFCELSNAQCSDDKASAGIGEVNTCKITIVDDDQPGVLYFQKESDTIMEEVEDRVVAIKIERKNGSRGVIKCKYKSENDTAIAPHDYLPLNGTLTFESGQMSATIEVTIKACGRYDGTEMFRIVLTEPEGGATFESSTDGGEDSCIMTIFIKADKTTKTQVDSLTQLLKMNWDKCRVGNSNYSDQIWSALYCNGSKEDQAEASISDWVTHLIAVPWKLLFSLVPPTDYGNGWVCFFVALTMIGAVTAIIGDMASLLGCTMNVPDSITAITFVALGTSLPDTFASKTAAVQDPYADAAIGNVTGSNAVNVFLGLGLPWLMGAIYWANPSDSVKADWISKYEGEDVIDKYPDGGFVVLAGDLSFSVIVFSVCACLCIALLVVRRSACGGELGGPRGAKFASAAFCVALWFVYVGLSSWKALSSLNE